MRCTNCGFENPNAARFCMDCGTRLDLACPQCGAKLPGEANFCMACGTRMTEAPLAAPAAPAVPRLEELQDRIYIPKPLSERMLAAEQELVGENRLVTALFADISNFTPLSRQYPAERVVEIVNECFRSIVDAVLTYEGTISQFLGDCVLAFFGAPILHENDPERAILAALAIQREARRLSLSLSVGINSGMVYFGPVGTQEHREISAYGSEINLAKRLQEAAGEGQILVGASTYRFTRRAFEFRKVEGLALKGISDAPVAYEALCAREHPEKVRGIEGLRARMIGQEREFADLKEACDQWRSPEARAVGGGQMVSIIGEAGIGKSRLVSELKRELADERAADGPPSCLEGRCVSIGQPISYWPFLDIEALERLQALPDSPQRTRQELLVQLGLGAPLLATRGYASPEVEQAYARARDLCRKAGDIPELFSVTHGLWTNSETRSPLPIARNLAEELLKLAQREGDPARLMVAHRSLGDTLTWMGEFALAREHLEQALALYNPLEHRALLFLHGRDSGVLGLCYAAHVLWYLGYPDQALTTSDQALALARELAHPFTLGHALVFAAWLRQHRREGPAARELAEEAIAVSTEHDIAIWAALGAICLGWALTEQGEAAEGIARMREGLAALRVTGARLSETVLLGILAEGYRNAGQPQEGLFVVSEALSAVEAYEERCYEADWGPSLRPPRPPRLIMSGLTRAIQRWTGPTGVERESAKGAKTRGK